MTCKIPCCDCDNYSDCTTLLPVKNRCRKCIYDKEDLLTSPCKDCRGFGFINKDKPDLFKSYYVGCEEKKE